MTDHTPTPYVLLPGRNRHYLDASRHSYEHAMQACYYLAGPDGPSHFVADLIVQGDDEGHAVASFIVRACNSHAALLEACKVVLGAINPAALARSKRSGNDCLVRLRYEQAVMVCEAIALAEQEGD